MASAAAIPSVPLPDGSQMPKLAIGLYNVARDHVATVINAALDAGCRHFDSASFYNNEAEVGEVLKKWLASGHSRSELYIETKVWTTDMIDAAAALRSAQISIDELDLDYVDLVMVHWPMPGKHVAAYVALEELVRTGKTKGLGISNYSPADYEELMQSATIPPRANTFENNPMLYRKDWVDYFQDKGIVIQAYKPFQRGGPILTSDAVKAIADRLSKTPAQVCLRWNIEKGNVVIFKSNTPARFAENAAIFDFELSPEDIASLDALTTEEAKSEAKAHWEKRRNGTTAPWGDGLRPEKRLKAEA